jgi:transcriptional regulator with XRE-family HTH domain
MNTIGKNIRMLRQKKGWNQSEVARILAISIPAYSKIETGMTDINITRLAQIAEIFGVLSTDILSQPSEMLKVDPDDEIVSIKDQLALKDAEIIRLQNKAIALYEELRSRKI